jgi:hypothetical protein
MILALTLFAAGVAFAFVFIGLYTLNLLHGGISDLRRKDVVGMSEIDETDAVMHLET